MADVTRRVTRASTTKALNGDHGVHENQQFDGKFDKQNGNARKSKTGESVVMTGSSLLPIFISLMIDLTSFTIILPLLPSILQYYKGKDDNGVYEVLADRAKSMGSILGAPSETKSETVLVAGILGSVFSILQFVSMPIVGSISDRMGRRLALILCLVGICVSHLIWYFSWNLEIFILARIIGGLSRANVSICSTVVADDCPPDMRPKGMAMIGIAFSVGFTVGPSIGAYFASSGSLFTPALASLCLSLVALLITMLFVKETLPLSFRAKQTDTNLISYIWPPCLFNFRLVSVGHKLKPIGMAYFLYIFLYSGLEFTLTFLTQTNLNFSPTDQGKMFTFVGITMAFVQGAVTRRLKPSMESGAVMIGMLITIPAFVIIGFSKDTVQLTFGLTCYSIGSAIVSPCLTSITASKVTNPNEKGVALGIFRSLGALARSLGPLAASSLFWRMGPTASYTIGAVFLLVPLALFRKAMKVKS